MTRIVKAVQRARTQPAGPPMRVVVPRDVPPESLFVDAWDFGADECPSARETGPASADRHQVEAAPAHPPAPAPVTPPAPVVWSAPPTRAPEPQWTETVQPRPSQDWVMFAPPASSPLPAAVEPASSVELPHATAWPTVAAPPDQLRSGAEPWPVVSPASSFSLPTSPGLAFVPSAEDASAVIGRASAPVASDMREKVVAADFCPPLMREQYRRLAAALHQAQSDRGIRSVLIVSPGSGEGRSLTAVNLAATLSSSYRRRVLLVDADLRSSTLHTVFGTPGAPGLLEAVRGGTAVQVTPLTDHLSLVPAGSPGGDPIEVLSSGRMRDLLRAARRDYDWVVVDTAPLAQVPDAGLLMDDVDAAILVLQAGHTPFDLVERCLRLIPRDRLLGAVLNGAHPRDMGGTALPAAAGR